MVSHKITLGMLTDAHDSRAVTLLAASKCQALPCRWALRLAADAATTVLKVDQIIMAKVAGGQKPRAPGPMDED